MKKGLRYVAILEGSKGLIALIVGLNIHRLAHGDIQNYVESFSRHLHLNPASEYIGVIFNELNKFTYSNLSLIAIGSLIYTGVRFIEAIGLWNEFKWVEWFALISGAIYIPFELYELFTSFGALSIFLLTINVMIVLYLYSVLKNKRESTNA